MCAQAAVYRGPFLFVFRPATTKDDLFRFNERMNRIFQFLKPETFEMDNAKTRIMVQFDP